MKYLVSIFLINITSSCLGQTKQITIKVVDSATNQPLQSVSVKLLNTRYANITDENGKCQIDQTFLKGDTSCFVIEAFYATRNFCIIANKDYSADFIFRIPHEEAARKGHNRKH